MTETRASLTPNTLAHAVRAFAERAADWPDAELERPWAWKAYDDEGVRFAFLRTYEELRELAATTAAERQAAGPAVTTAQRALGQYHAAYRDLQAVLLGVSDALAAGAPAADGWPVRDAVEHIVRTERQFFARIWYAVERQRANDQRPLEMPKGALDAYLQVDARVDDAILQAPLGALMRHFDAFHDRVLTSLAPIADEELSAPSIWWEKYEVEVRFRLHRFDSHLRQHTIQVEKTLVTLAQPATETRRLLRLIYNALAECEATVIGTPQFAGDRWQTAAAQIAARLDEVASAR